MIPSSCPTRALGSGGPQVSALGLGCMGMSQAYGPADEAESLRTLDRALELGIYFLDTADVYGQGHNERLLARALHGRRERVFLATKFGIRRDGPMAGSICGRPEYVRSSCEASLARLETDHIDLYYLHRVDPEVPIEETVGAMAELVAAGKVRHLGLSEASADSLARACAVHPISALQSEWSLWTRDLEPKVLGTARGLGVGIVPYSPLGRGFLSGRLRSPQDFGPDDFRSQSPRFQGENFSRNLELVAKVEQIAAELEVTPAQLAIAWLLHQGDDVIPIPGTKRVATLEENFGAVGIRLAADQVRALSDLFPAGTFAGDRYPDPSYRYGESPLPS